MKTQISLDYVNRDTPIIKLSKTCYYPSTNLTSFEFQWYCSMPPDAYAELYDALFTYRHGESAEINYLTGQITIE